MTLKRLFKPQSYIFIVSFRRFVGQRSAISRAYSMDIEMASPTWRGVPMSEIVGSQSPWGAPEFPLVTPSHNHTVLYHISSNRDMGDRPPKPQVGQDKWDSDHVRMPCSSKSLYPVEDSNGETYLKKRWEMIEDALRRPILNSRQLADAILSYNTKFKNIWKFRALHSLFNHYLEEEETQYFFTVTLPEIAKLALDLPKLIQAPIPLLKQNKNRSISLTQQQISSLLANAFFCTFPRRNTTKRASEYSSYPHINFSTLYECEDYNDVMEKLKCICHYFRRVCTKAPGGVATFSRRAVAQRACPAWARSAAPLSAVPLHVDSAGSIETAHGLIQLDFANKYLGGGVLGHGSVQEEIRFVISPELMVSMLFTEMLRPTEALIMIGCERYSDHIGYSRTFQWSGDHRDSTPYDSAGRRRIAVLAVDALPFTSKVQEFQGDMVTRELNKAWVGYTFFSDEQASLQYPGIATGNWGCGAFGGTPQLKSLIQLMACAHARRPMAYYTFGDTEIRDEVISIYNILARYNVTVGQLFQYIARFSTIDVRRSQLHSYLQQLLIDEEKRPPKKSPDRMDTSTSPKTGQTFNLKQKELLNDSPDLFSQDEYQSLNQLDVHSNLAENQPSKSDTSSKDEMADNENKMALHTKSLFEQLNRFDSDNGKLKLNMSPNESITSECFGSPKADDNIKSTSTKMDNIEINMASSSKNTYFMERVESGNIVSPDASTSRLFNEMQKFDEEHGRLNLSNPHTSAALGNNINITRDSHISMEHERLEASPEIKKKITRKITDYFSKKST